MFGSCVWYNSCSFEELRALEVSLAAQDHDSKRRLQYFHRLSIECRYKRNLQYVLELSRNRWFEYVAVISESRVVSLSAE